MNDGGDVAGAGRPAVRLPAPVQSISYLDRALWTRLADAGSPAGMARCWLDLQCLMIEGVARGAVFLEQDGSGLTLEASWPDSAANGPTSLLGTARRAVSERRGVVSGHRGEARLAGALCCCAYPLLVDDELHGAVALEISDRSQEELRQAMRALQWGAGWFEVASRRDAARVTDGVLYKTVTTLDVLGALVEQPTFKGAASALVTQLALHLGCEFAAVGSLRRDHMRVASLSHSAEFGQRMGLMRLVASAMDEAADQQASVVWPAGEGGEYRVTLAHERLSRTLEGATVLSFPLLADGRAVGALLLVRAVGQSFDQDTVDLCDAVAAAAGPVLEDKRRNDRHLLFKLSDATARQVKRLFGPHYPGRKLAAAILLGIVAALMLVEDDYRVTSPARIEGSVQRVIVAPFDGYVMTQSARAGDRVRAGEVLARLDDRDLRLEHMRWTTTREQRLAEYDQAIGNHDRATAAITRAQIRQAEAHIALIDEQLARTSLTAAFDAVVVSGDLSQAIGAAVSRGEQLFELAPLDEYRVILEVDESQVLDIEAGQRGSLKVGALLDRTLEYQVVQVTPITEAREGRNYFRVEATLGDVDAQLRPGMEGVAKTEVGSRRLISIWTGGLVDWMRLKLWAWWP